MINKIAKMVMTGCNRPGGIYGSLGNGGRGIGNWLNKGNPIFKKSIPIYLP
jgi:hypothetical protein